MSLPSPPEERPWAPELRIRVKPYEGVWHRWTWEVQVRDPGTKVWRVARAGLAREISGFSRTKEGALDAGRKAAAAHHERLIRESLRASLKDDETVVEPFDPLRHGERALPGEPSVPWGDEWDA